MSSLISLPVDDFLPQIEKHLQANQNLVITAAPGAGKTTRLPPALMKACTGKVLVLEPRRMAAIAACHRIAEEQEWTVGEEIGYQVRFANKTSAKSRLIFMTEALLARQMIHDPELNGVDIVILDEFHERSAHVDLALGLLRELQELGSPIKIVVMSATLEAEKISSYLGTCPIVSVPGKLFDLTVHYQKNSQILQTFPVFYDSLFQTVKEAQSKTKKDLLVFLPGVGEIERAKDTLQSWADTKSILLVPLHGSLSLEDQKKALSKTSQQRIILSTNIAESSVTLDGVDTVIDSGLSKSLRQDHKTGFSRLELGRISLSSAIQRSGRAARQYPGSCYRLWNKHDELSFSKGELPEIQRIDLSESLLFLAAQGVQDFQNFTWFEKPTATAIENALRFLRLSDALDSENRITALGQTLLQFPLPVRLAKLMTLGLEMNAVEVASCLAALLQERDILRKDHIDAYVGDNFENDLAARLEVLKQFRSNKRAPGGTSYIALQTVDQSARQIEDICKKIKKSSVQSPPPDLFSEKILLLKAYSDRLCRRRGKTDRALMVGGRGVKLQKESLVKNSEFFVAINGVESHSDAETMVSLACGFDKDFILTHFKEKIERSSDVTFIEEKGQFFTREYRVLHGLPLDEAQLSPASKEEIQKKLPFILADKFDLVLKNNEELSFWWQRLQFLKRNSDLVLDEDTLKQEAFSQACLGENNMNQVIAKDLVFYFENVLDQNLVQELRKNVPNKIEVPSGSHIRVQYPEDKPPYMEVRIQEMFGLMQTPQVLSGKIPVTLHLLGPNYRPVQVTSSLESFWKNAYPEVRKELRLKYPKHQWPEDPADGTPEAKGRRRF